MITSVKCQNVKKNIINNFWNWIRILFLTRIWFSPGSSSPIYNVFLVSSSPSPMWWVLQNKFHCRLEMKSPGKTRFLRGKEFLSNSRNCSLFPFQDLAGHVGSVIYWDHIHFVKFHGLSAVIKRPFPQNVPWPTKPKKSRDNKKCPGEIISPKSLFSLHNSVYGFVINKSKCWTSLWSTD